MALVATANEVVSAAVNRVQRSAQIATAGHEAYCTGHLLEHLRLLASDDEARLAPPKRLPLVLSEFEMLAGTGEQLVGLVENLR
jgi:hypothetical protein